MANVSDCNNHTNNPRPTQWRQRRSRNAAVANARAHAWGQCTLQQRLQPCKRVDLIERGCSGWPQAPTHPTQIFIRSPPSRQHKAPPQNSENKRQWTTRQHKCVGEELLQVQTVHTHTHKRPAKRAPPLLSVGGFFCGAKTKQQNKSTRTALRFPETDIRNITFESVKV
jgi:hypothetical protein